MKVVHISTYDNGGAGLAAYRLHRGLLDAGIDSKMLVSQKTTNDDSIVLAHPDVHMLYQPPKNVILRKYKKIMRRRGHYLTDVERTNKELSQLGASHPSVFYTSPISSFDLSNHPLVQQADIIHLHWVQNFLNYGTFFENVKTPIVWTFHDLNPLFGGFHYDIPRKKYCDDYKQIEERFCTIKKNSIKHAPNLSIVAISKQMHTHIANHFLFKEKKIYDIPNGVNASSFILHDRNKVREILSIPMDKKIFFFSSLFLNDERKGLNILIKAFEILKLEKALLLCLGNGNIPLTNSIDIRHFYVVSDTEWLSLLYSAADYYIAPSFEESFLQTAVESMYCGTPVIMTPVGICDDLINDFNGIRCTDFTPEAIAKGIRMAMEKEYNRERIREDVVSRFNLEKITSQYFNLYNSLLHRSN